MCGIPYAMQPYRKAAYQGATCLAFNIGGVYGNVTMLTAKPVGATKVDVVGDLDSPQYRLL